MARGWDLALELRYSNHCSADVQVDQTTNKIRDDGRLDHPLVSPPEAAARIPGLRVSPMAVIKIQY